MASRKKARSQESLVNVAVIAAIREPLTYRVPRLLEVVPGQRVIVPLGNRKAIGVTLEPVAQIPAGLKTRDILHVVDPEPVLSPELLTLGIWIADYYMAPIGEVFRAMLPLGAAARHTRVINLTEEGKRRLEELKSSLLAEVREGEESAFLEYVKTHPTVTLETLRRKFAGSGRKLLTQALDMGWVTIHQVEREGRKTLAVSLAGEPPGASIQTPQRRPSAVAARILEALRAQRTVADHRALLRSTRGSLAHLRKLEQEGLIELTETHTNRSLKRNPEDGLSFEEKDSRFAVPKNNGKGRQSPAGVGGIVEPSWELTASQSSALETLGRQLEANQFSVFLLHGVTGSGKTEIYLRLAERCLDLGRSALLLVPEIALTPMLQAQFTERFGGRVAVLHSGLTEAQRRDEWWRVWRGEAQVVLGTRSAVFSPLENLGLVVVDEEHDSSYKQQETPRYHGRDVAVIRARLAKALVVLGSATPSLESYWNAQQGKYQLLTLNQRVAGRRLAEVEIIDMRQEFRETHSKVPVSRQLQEEIELQLATGGQTMILLNRRGYAWFLLCRSCGEAITCIRCSISLTYHRREHRLICHYCGYTTKVPTQCPACGSEHLYYIGEGTEKVEDKLRDLFPGAKVERLDRDVASRPGHYLRVLSDFRERKIDILVGTQLIAKGHDFPGVTLVGVVSADMGLRLPDFRAAERTFQLLTQAAGRAGRGDAPGRVLVQTFYPEHYAIRLAADQNYPGFFSKEMSFRRVMHYPPTTALVNVIAQDEKLDQAARVAYQLGESIKRIADTKKVRMLGPNAAPLARIEGRYRIQILLKASSRSILNRVLRHMTEECERHHIPPRSVLIDVDPVNIM
jgi:primosomal protein N' (replication factor Y)